MKARVWLLWTILILEAGWAPAYHESGPSPVELTP